MPVRKDVCTQNFSQIEVKVGTLGIYRMCGDRQTEEEQTPRTALHKHPALEEEITHRAGTNSSCRII